jgi:hypothetical protein
MHFNHTYFFENVLIILNSNNKHMATQTQFASLLHSLRNITCSDYPVAYVEPTCVEFQSNDACSDSLGMIVAPRGISARDIEVREFPSCVRPGFPLQFELVQCNTHSTPSSVAETATGSAFLARHVFVRARVAYESQPHAALSFDATIVPLATVPSITITIGMQHMTDFDFVVVDGISIAGESVVCGMSFPMKLAIRSGMHAPLRFTESSRTTPVITAAGTMYMPSYDRVFVRVIAADGAQLCNIFVSDVGLSKFTRTAAFVDSTNTLLLAETNSGYSRIAAIDMTKRTVRWFTSPRCLDHVYGLAVLVDRGVAFASSLNHDKVYIHCLSSGMRVGSVDASKPSFLAINSANKILYASVYDRSNTRNQIVAFAWDDVAATLGAKATPVVAAEFATSGRPLAVIPPSVNVNTSASYLVVVTYGESTLRVIALPDHRLVHTHRCDGMRIMGLAADPSGNAVAIYDAASDTVHVLSWPLPGMPY